MKDNLKEYFHIILVILQVAVICFVLSSLGFLSYSYFAPKYQAVDNEVYHESQQYNEGMIRDLENLQVEYINATLEGKQSLRAIILHRFSVYPENKLSPNLRSFYNQLKSN